MLDGTGFTGAQNQDALRGINPGFDAWDITGKLILDTTNGQKIKIDITSLGAITNWDAGHPGLTREFTIITATGGIDGFDASMFNLDDTNFNQSTNPYSTIDSQWWYVHQAGNNIILTYVPEPGTLGLLALGALALRGRRRNRK